MVHICWTFLTAFKKNPWKIPEIFFFMMFMHAFYLFWNIASLSCHFSIVWWMRFVISRIWSFNSSAHIGFTHVINAFDCLVVAQLGPFSDKWNFAQLTIFWEVTNFVSHYVAWCTLIFSMLAPLPTILMEKRSSIILSSLKEFIKSSIINDCCKSLLTNVITFFMHQLGKLDF